MPASFDLIAETVAALPVAAKMEGMWRSMRRLSRTPLSGAHAVLLLAMYGRVRLSRDVPTFDLAELAREVGVTGATVAVFIDDLEALNLVLTDGRTKMRSAIRATLPCLLADCDPVTQMRPEWESEVCTLH